MKPAKAGGSAAAARSAGSARSKRPRIAGVSDPVEACRDEIGAVVLRIPPVVVSELVDAARAVEPGVSTWAGVFRVLADYPVDHQARRGEERVVLQRLLQRAACRPPEDFAAKGLAFWDRYLDESGPALISLLVELFVSQREDRDRARSQLAVAEDGRHELETVLSFVAEAAGPDGAVPSAIVQKAAARLGPAVSTPMQRAVGALRAQAAERQLVAMVEEALDGGGE